MTREDVINAVEDIRMESEDDERAHSLEDDLYEQVLLAVINNNPESKEMAKEALKTKEIKFSRWCA